MGGGYRVEGKMFKDIKHCFNNEQVNILSLKASPQMCLQLGKTRTFSYHPQPEMSESGKQMPCHLTQEGRSSGMAGCPQGQALPESNSPTRARPGRKVTSELESGNKVGGTPFYL